MIRTVLIVVAAGTALACASVPAPREEVAQAEVALRQAVNTGGQEYAAVEVRMAREKLERAERALRSEDYVEARRAAEQAQADAQLAAAKARRGRAVTAADEMERTLGAMNEEMAR